MPNLKDLAYYLRSACEDFATSFTHCSQLEFLKKKQ